MREIMTVKEVAEYLRVSERDVHDLAQKGDLPGGKLGTTWRFKRDDVENWVNSRLSGKASAPSSPAPARSALLTPGRVLLLDHVEKEKLLAQMVDLLAKTPYVRSREGLLQAINAREELMSTGIGFGVGIPHARIDSVTNLVMAVAVCTNPIENYVALDDKPVHIVCMVAARSDQHKEYVSTLAAISSLLKKPDVREKIIASDNPAAISMLFTEAD